MKRRHFFKLFGLTTSAITLSSWEFIESSLLADPEFDKTRALNQIEKLRGEPPARAQIRVERGGPRLFLNGEEIYPFMALSTHLYPTIGSFKKAGINIYHPILGMRSGWLGPNQYDWTLIDAFLGRLLELNPDAYFLPRIQLNTPNWWKEAHPSELIKYGLPTPKKKFDIIKNENLSQSEGGYYFLSGGELWEASFASEIWRKDTAIMLKAFVQHIEESPINSRIIGYQPTTGRTAEWNYFGPDYLPDYSAPMQNALGKIPEPQARLETTFGLLRDPEKEREVITFYQKYHETIADTVLYMAHTFKQATNRRVLCGVFYGYLLEQVRIQEGGYLATRKILESPDIDFLACPYTYQEGNVRNSKGVKINMIDGAGNLFGSSRGVGGDGGYRMLVESVKRHGKLYISEMDPSTYLDVTPHSVIGGLGGRSSHTLEGSKLILQRDLGQVFASGVGGWLYDFGPLNKAKNGWYSSEPLIAEIKRLVALGDRRMELDIGSVSQIAAVYDTKSFFATAHWNADRPWYDYGIRYTDFFNHWFVNTQARAFHRIGAPMDFLHNFDLQPTDTAKYRLIFMVNMFHLTSDEINRLKALIRGSGMTVVWYYAPGFIAANKLDLGKMEELTGFQFKVLRKPGPMMIRANIKGKGQSIRMRFGVNAHHYPRFAVISDDSEGLGLWQDMNEVAFAMKKHEGYKSVYVGTAPLPTLILRWLVEQSEIPLWSSEPDIICATRDTAMIVATEKGERKLTLHKAMVSIDGGAAQREHILNMDFGEVKIFAAES
ncbi:MAG: hypothetical protein V3U73_00285 [bacterium]